MKSLKEKLEDLAFRLYRIAGRTLIKYSGNPRPATPPFVTGDGFRSMADHVYDKLEKGMNPLAVKDRDVVFVGDSLIKEYLANVHPRINCKYVLVTHNGDAPVDAAVLALTKNKIYKWYGINVTVADPLVVPIPLGIENKHYYLCGIPGIFKWVNKMRYPKRDRIFYGFTVSTNPAERQPALDAMKRNPLAETLTAWRGFNAYLHVLATYKFVVSPPGSSVEGHRTWDALYIGIVPIVKSSVTTDYFEHIGVPLWNVKDWRELDGLGEQDLAHKFDAVRAAGKSDTLLFSYWEDKIRNTRE